LVDLVSTATALTMNVLARRRWLNLSLLGLVGGLMILVLLEPGRESSVAVPPLLELASARIERIRIERSGQEPLAFTQRGDDWWMVAPETGLANPVLVSPIGRLPEMRCPRRYAVDEVDLKRLNLNPPRLRLWLNEREIRFGGTDSTDTLRYVQVGATVFLCGDNIYPLLTSAAGGFLAPSIESLTPTHPSDE
jgi:hypothetical protein